MFNYQALKPLKTLEDLFSLKGRVGLITGGAGKLACEFARILSLAGARIVIADLDQKQCDSAAERLSKDSPLPVTGKACDVSQKDQVKDLFSFINREFGRLDFFISNVMGKTEDYYAPFEDYPEEAWDKVLDVNLKGNFFCCREASEIMKKQGSGSIILTSSVYGFVGPDQRIYRSCSPLKNPYGGEYKLNAPGAYASSKGGIIALARYLSALLGEHAIRVNVLTPGGVYDGHEPAFHEAYVNKVPLGRMGSFTDYNGAVLFLASDASRYMTGMNLVIDGGWSAW